MKRLVMHVCVGCCAILGGASAVLLLHRLESPAVAQLPRQLPAPPTTELTRLSDQFESVARKVSPAVVSIEATKAAASSNSSAAKPRSIEESGSGVLIRLERHSEVYALTNNHVISQAAPEQITITLENGRVYRPSRVLADPESDIALLCLNASEQLTSATLGDSDSVRVGQWVVAIGSPFGLSQSVTHGIISARERGQVSLGSTIRIKDFLQTDAAINPGSSGGPLANLDGEVIGLNTAIASNSGSNSGVAFSIPINLVKRVARQLLERGSVARGYLGLQLSPSFEPTDALRLGLDRVHGALVETVFPQTPAGTAGLKANDVILQVDGASIRNETHLINVISGLQAGHHVKLQVWRDRHLQTIDAEVGDWTQGKGRFK